MNIEQNFAVGETAVSQGISHKNRVYSAGEGQALVFLHGPFGQEWNPFLTRLAENYRVVAPEIPGADDPADLTQLLNFWDLIVYYDELFDNLGLDNFVLVGHSFGGMIAAEYAAVFRSRVSKLILIDPMGLWDDAYPVADFVSGERDELERLMWVSGAPSHADPFRPRTDIDPELATEELLRKFLSVAAAANFAHPIPDKGLHSRLHRIRAPTLLLWGERDRFVSPEYATMFGERIPNAQLEVIAGAAHYPHLEQMDDATRRVNAFLMG